MTKKKSKTIKQKVTEISDLHVLKEFRGLNGNVTPGNTPIGYTQEDINEAVRIIRENGLILRAAGISVGEDVVSGTTITTSSGKSFSYYAAVYPERGIVKGHLSALSGGDINKGCKVLAFEFETKYMGNEAKEHRYTGNLNVNYWIAEYSRQRDVKRNTQTAIDTLVHEYLLRQMNLVSQSDSEPVNGELLRKEIYTAPPDLTIISQSNMVEPKKGNAREYLDMYIRLGSYTVPVDPFIEQMKEVIAKACKR
ncbi:MAG: hypothetical protein ACMXYG_03295 [Candidatus Woesearchaeota archaeon]